MGLDLEHVGIATSLSHEDVMSAAFCNVAVLQEYYPVAEAGRAEPVGDEDAGLALGELVVMLVHVQLCQGIQSCGGFIQEKHGRVLV